MFLDFVVWGIGGSMIMTFYSMTFVSLVYLVTREIPDPPDYNKTGFLINLLVIFLEEFFFRLVPFAILMISDINQNLYTLSLIILLSSLLFSLLHLTEGQLSVSSLVEIFLGGAFLFIIYLKAGFIVVVLAHILRNYLVTYVYNNLIYRHLVIYEVNRLNNS